MARPDTSYSSQLRAEKSALRKKSAKFETMAKRAVSAAEHWKAVAEERAQASDSAMYLLLLLSNIRESGITPENKRALDELSESMKLARTWYAVKHVLGDHRPDRR